VAVTVVGRRVRGRGGRTSDGRDTGRAVAVGCAGDGERDREER
jgi:hypothetical protein